MIMYEENIVTISNKILNQNTAAREEKSALTTLPNLLLLFLKTTIVIVVATSRTSTTLPIDIPMIIHLLLEFTHLPSFAIKLQ